jgi:hypothetical protein
MAKKKRGKFKSGTWLTREMCLSWAYLSLRGFSTQLLSLFLLKRDFNKKHECLNCERITMTYVELEALGISKPRITRSRDDLMAKGFIRIVHQGGAYQEDKNIYALTEDWRWWQSGQVIYERPKDTRQRGYIKPKKK